MEVRRQGSAALRLQKIIAAALRAVGLTSQRSPLIGTKLDGKKRKQSVR
jgi:hypothetical protein